MNPEALVELILGMEPEAQALITLLVSTCAGSKTGPSVSPALLIRGRASGISHRSRQPFRRRQWPWTRPPPRSTPTRSRRTTDASP
jgi:hypothetical protein